MWKAIGITDIHMAQRHTRYRADAGDDIIAKLNFVVARCEDAECPLLVAGDWFHSSRVGWGTVRRLHDAILPLAGRTPIIGVAGQHDLPEHGDWLNGPLYPLSWVGDCGEGFPIDLNGYPYPQVAPGSTLPEVLLVPFGASLEPGDITERSHLIIIHAMIVPKPVPWEHITFEQFAELVPDGEQCLIFCGDYHAGFEPTQVRNLLFVNPGALARVKRDEAHREPKYAALEWDGETWSVEYHVIPHRPAEEVFDMTDYGVETTAPPELSAFVEQVRALDTDASEIDVDAAAAQIWSSLWPDTEPSPEVVGIVRRALEDARDKLGYGG